MAKKKIKIDLSGGWRDVLEQAIDVNEFFANESDLDEKTVMEVTDRNVYIYVKLINEIRTDDTILLTASDTRTLFRILMEDYSYLRNEIIGLHNMLHDGIDVIKSCKELSEEIIDEYGLDIDED